MSEGTNTTHDARPEERHDDRHDGRGDDHAHGQTVVIKVNRKPVKVNGPKLTGLQIKQAAIEQRVDIQLDFQLAEIRPGGEQQIIGDSDVVNVTKHSEFVATAGDDNS